MKKLIILFCLILFSCIEKTEKNKLSEKTKKDNSSSSKTSSVSKIRITSSLIIDFSEGYPILKDIKKNFILLDFHPPVGQLEYNRVNDSTYNFITYTALPNNKGKFISCTPIFLTVVFNGEKYNCFRKKEKENIPIIEDALIQKLFEKYELIPKKSAIAKKNVEFEPKESYEEWSIFQGQLIVGALNGNKKCLEIYKKMYKELPEEYFLGASDEEYSQFLGVYEEYIKKY